MKSMSVHVELVTNKHQPSTSYRLVELTIFVKHVRTLFVPKVPIQVVG